MRVFIPAIGLSMALCGPIWAQTLTKTVDSNGTVHFGTAEHPNKCCYCAVVIEETAQGYLTQTGQLVETETIRQFINGTDGQTWACPTLGTQDSEIVIPGCIIKTGMS